MAISREALVSEVSHELERVQYDDNDGERLGESAVTFVLKSQELIEALARYTKELNAPVDEDSKERMGTIRRALVEKWAVVQGVTSKMAWTLRIDGDEAYKRFIQAIKKGEEPNMEGL
jgi:hypothetical protein